MNYYKLYFELMQKGINRINMKSNAWEYDAHHIIPKQYGGPDIVLNIALLTPKEHRLAHKLLRMIPIEWLTHKGIHRCNSLYHLKRTISRKKKEKKTPIDKKEQNRRAYERRKQALGKEKKPPMTNAERTRKCREKKKERNRLDYERRKQALLENKKPL